MTKEEIVDQINKSYNEHTGTNEAIDDAAHFIYEKYNLEMDELLDIVIKLQSMITELKTKI